MKYTIPFITILLLAVHAMAQDEGDEESFSHIKNKTIRKEVASFTEAGADENKPAINLKKLPLAKFGPGYSTFEKDSIMVKLTIGKFIKAKHAIKYVDKFAQKIDNKRIWGTDGELPKEQINSIEVRIGKDTVIVPKSAFQNLYEPSLAWKEGGKTVGNLSVYYSNDKTRFYIAMSNSDGAGFYEATLIIKDRKYFGRVLDEGF